jgi:hypothetical protein
MITVFDGFTEALLKPLLTFSVAGLSGSVVW